MLNIELGLVLRGSPDDGALESLELLFFFLEFPRGTDAQKSKKLSEH